MGLVSLKARGAFVQMFWDDYERGREFMERFAH